MQTTIRRVALAAAAVALLPTAAPALARTKKPTTIRLPASTLKDPTARLCMPKSVIVKPDAALPNTICQTKDEWAAAGVTIVPR